MGYSEIKAALALNTAYDAADASFLAALPDAIAYAEGRITRELDLMAANVTDSSGSTAALTRTFNIPTALGTFLVVDSINVITPAATGPDSGTRNALIPVSQQVLDFTWPSTAGATVPQYFAYVSQNTYSSPAQKQILFGPWPDAAYSVEVTGKVQPATLSASNAQTWLSENLPDVLIAGCMIYLTGALLKNFGAQADDPRSSLSWQTIYDGLMQGAMVYEARKRFAGASWTSKQPEPVAAPQRG